MLPLVADDTVERGTIWAPFNQAGADITDLVDADQAGDRRPRSRGSHERVRRCSPSDPLLDTDDWWWQVLAIVAGKVLAIFVIGLVGTMFMVWFERKIVSGMQNRVGPNKAGPFGMLQTLADGMKLFFKEDLLPEKADKWVFRLSPFLAFVPAFLLWSVIPLGGDFTDGKDGTVEMFGHTTRVQLVDPPMGILIVLALSSIGVYGIMLAGWASGSKYPLLGSVRASAQMISYEAALGLSLAAVLLMSGTLSTSGIVAGQDGVGNWNIVATGFIPFVDLPDRHDRRAEPAAVRPRRGRTGAGRWVQHRVLVDPVRAVLPRRVHERDHDERDHGDPVPRRPAAARGFAGIVRHSSDGRARSAARSGCVLKVLALPLHLRLVPCDPAPPALRPADGLRLEAADPGRARLVPGARRAPDGP